MISCRLQFFCLQIIQNLSMAVGPIAQYNQNSKYYSARKPRPNKIVDDNLPHITIQMPVYKESLENVLAPSIESLKRAMQTYARQGGTSTIFINDDGLRVISREDRDTRIAYYANHGIGWVARPKHDDAADGFKRAGRFKKASNMNYGLALSLKAEQHLAALQTQEKARSSRDNSISQAAREVRDDLRYGMQYQDHDGEDQGIVEIGREEGGATDSGEWEDLEEKALMLAIDEVYEASGHRWRPWAANGRACRLGEIILLVDSDTIVPEDCLRDAAREMAECPTVAIIQHESGECLHVFDPTVFVTRASQMSCRSHITTSRTVSPTSRGGSTSVSRSVSHFNTSLVTPCSQIASQLLLTVKSHLSSDTMRSCGGKPSRTQPSSTKMARRRSGPRLTYPKISTWLSVCNSVATLSGGRRTQWAPSRRVCRSRWTMN